MQTRQTGFELENASREDHPTGVHDRLGAPKDCPDVGTRPIPVSAGCWEQAQRGERQFWLNYLNSNSDGDQQWLRYVLAYFCLSDGRVCDGETLVDIGSGPIGILTRLTGHRRIAVDPLGVESLDKRIERIKAPGEATTLPSNIADRVFIYNVLQHVFAPESVLHEAVRVLRPMGRIYLLEQLYFPTDREHPHSLTIDMFDRWYHDYRFKVLKYSFERDRLLSSVNNDAPNSGYAVLCLILQKCA